MANIDFTSFKGLADSKWSAAKGKYPKMVGLNIHDTPGLLKVNQKLTEDSSGVVNEFCRVAVSLSTGIRLWFSYESGKIWAESGGTYTLVYTTAPAAGAALCLGAAEYNTYVYWGTQSREHRIPVANATASAASWTANVTLNWNTFGITNASFHPHVVQNQTLWIGDGNRIASVNSSATFAANALDIISPLIIKDMAPWDIDLVLGTIITNTVNNCRIIRWDTVQTTWQFAEPVQENGINAFLWIGNALVAQAGTYGNFYYYDGQFLQPLNRLPGTWTPTRYGEVYPGSSATFRGVALFGFSNSQDAANTTGNPADQGVYTMGRYSKDYPLVINGPEYVISTNDVTDVQIGAILVVGQNVYAAWEAGGTSGVDKLDYTAKYSSAYMEFPSVLADPLDYMTFRQYVVAYASLPTGTDITFGYKANNASSFTTIGSGQHKNDTNSAVIHATEEVKARSFQLRADFTVSSNDGPEVEMFSVIL